MKITKEGKSWRKIKPKEILFINILRFMILMQQAEGRKKLLSLIIRENNNKELCIQKNHGRFRGRKMLIYNNNYRQNTILILICTKRHIFYLLPRILILISKCRHIHQFVKIWNVTLLIHINIIIHVLKVVLTKKSKIIDKQSLREGTLTQNNSQNNIGRKVILQEAFLSLSMIKKNFKKMMQQTQVLNKCSRALLPLINVILKLFVQLMKFEFDMVKIQLVTLRKGYLKGKGRWEKLIMLLVNTLTLKITNNLINLAIINHNLNQVKRKKKPLRIKQHKEKGHDYVYIEKVD